MTVGFLAHLGIWNRLFFTKTPETLTLSLLSSAGKNHGIQIALSVFI